MQESPHPICLDPGTAITIEAWVYPLQTNGSYEIYRKEDGSDRHLLSFQPGNLLAFGLNTGSGYTELDIAISPLDYQNQWVHIAATYDGTTKRVYRNGIEIGNAPATGIMSTSGSADSYIGSTNGFFEFFDGKIDEVRIWGLARTPSQIQNGMNTCFNAGNSGLLLNLNMNDGSGIVATDYSGNGLNATLLEGIVVHSTPSNVWSSGVWENVSNTLTVTQVLVPNRIYVDSSAIGNNSGVCWENAFINLQDALNTAQPFDSIWVADGTYYPDEGVGYTNDDRVASFFLPDSVAIYGGFNGTETLLSQRDWDVNLSILSGEIQQDGDSTNNSYVVVLSTVPAPVVIPDSTWVLDGFTITSGYLDESYPLFSTNIAPGLASYGTQQFSNLIIENNAASYMAFSGVSKVISSGMAYTIPSNTVSAKLSNITVRNNHLTLGVPYNTFLFWGIERSVGGAAIVGTSPTVNSLIDLDNFQIENNSVTGSEYGAAGGFLLLNISGTISQSTISNNFCGDRQC